MKKLNGYKEADKIDSSLNSLLEKHPITPKTNSEWSRLIRTVGTSLKIINEELKRRENK